VPTKLLSDKSSCESRRRPPNSDGSDPPRSLPAKSSVASLAADPTLAGREPVRLLSRSHRRRRRGRVHIDSGTAPVSSCEVNITSWSVWIRPISVGIVPVTVSVHGAMNLAHVPSSGSRPSTAACRHDLKGSV